MLHYYVQIYDPTLTWCTSPEFGMYRVHYVAPHPSHSLLENYLYLCFENFPVKNLHSSLPEVIPPCSCCPVTKFLDSYIKRINVFIRHTGKLHITWHVHRTYQYLHVINHTFDCTDLTAKRLYLFNFRESIINQYGHTPICSAWENFALVVNTRYRKW